MNLRNKMYCTKDVMKILHISKPTLYKLCRLYKIQPQTVGKHYRYSEGDIKRLLERKGVDTRDLELKFEEVVREVKCSLIEFANLIWEDGEERLNEILKDKSVFHLNKSIFKERENV